MLANGLHERARIALLQLLLASIKQQVILERAANYSEAGKKALDTRIGFKTTQRVVQVGRQGAVFQQ
ncbi:hypothetical protein D3C81_2174180 [compost metagenome]